MITRVPKVLTQRVVCPWFSRINFQAVFHLPSTCETLLLKLTGTRIGRKLLFLTEPRRASFFHNRTDQAELGKSMKLLELVENDVSYVVASSYLPDSASIPVKGASNICPRGLISHIRARIARSIKS